MATSTCYICDTSLESNNRSFEHIIPNSIGGIAGSYNLLCRNCNSQFGLEIEGDFAKSLNPICALLQIKRSRNDIPHIKNVTDKDGNIYHLERGRKPVKIKPEIKKQNNSYSISARNWKEAAHIIQKLKTKEPSLDTENWEQRLVETKKRLREPLHFEFKIGGTKFFRTVAKIAVNAYLFLGGDKKYITTTVEYIKGLTEDPTDFIHYHIEVEPVMELDLFEVCHCVYIKGDNKSKILFVYIELFNGPSFVVKLSDHFEEENFEKTYLIDVLEGNEVFKKVTVRYPDGASPKGYKPHDPVFFPIMQSRLSRLMKIAQVQQIKMTYQEEFAELWKECQESYNADPVNNMEQSLIFLDKVEKLKNELLNHGKNDV